MEEKINMERIVSAEIERLSKKFNKEYLDCADIIEITGLGRDNVRSIMNKQDFPKMRIGRRIVVSLSGFVIWQFKNMR